MDKFINWLTGNGDKEENVEGQVKNNGGKLGDGATEEEMELWNTSPGKAIAKNTAPKLKELEQIGKEGASIAVGFTPADIVKDVADFKAGKDTFTDEPISRVALGAMIFLPQAGDQVVRQVAKKGSKTAVKNGLQELSEVGLKSVKYGEQYTRRGLKKVLKPNVKYVTKEGYEYVTDSAGRIISTSGNLQKGTGKRSLSAQRNVGKPDYRLSTDDGGHLIGSQFNGSGKIDNLVPMNSQINRAGGKWYNMEQEWSAALTANKSVQVRIEPIYSGSTFRPDSFNVEYTIGNDDPVLINILNQSGG